MASPRKVKRSPTPRLRRSRKTTAGKDQLLCELELQQTVSAAHIRRLERIREELETSRQGFIALYERSPIGYVTLDHRGHIYDLNSAAASLLGLPRNRLLRLPFTIFINREDVHSVIAHLGRCERAREGNVKTEVRLKAHPAVAPSAVPERPRPVSIELISVPFTSARGHRFFLTALVDLTERHTSERELAEAKDFSESIVDTVRQPLAVLDAELRIISVNRAFTEYFKRPAQYARGRVFEVLLNLWWSGNQLRSDLEKVLVRNTPLEDVRLQVEPPGLGKRLLLLSARRLYQKETSPPFLLVALEDITEREASRDRLSKVNEELELRVATRTDALRKSYEQMEAFCYSIAHDLRAPLRSMTGFSQLLAEQYCQNIGPEGKRYAERIQQSADRMDKLISDLLHYGRLNTIDLPVEDVDLENIFNEVKVQLEREIDDRRARILKGKALPHVCGNRVVLQVALANLIANALKFVPSGTVPEISLWSEDRPAGTRVWVKDNGIGIAAENHHKIFGVFQRLHHSENYPGTGIGLALVSKGIERIGGRVGVESELGKGSRFWFELQKPPPKGPCPPVPHDH